MSHEVKPQKKSFVYLYLLKFLALFLLIALVLAAVNFFRPIPLLQVLLFLVMLLVFFYGQRRVQFAKELYLFSKHKIIWKSGGIFSDQETELMLKNITHVFLKQPFLESMFFGTGSLMIESAGSGATEIVLSHIERPLALYHFTQKAMQENGFSLRKEKIIQKETPHALGVFVEVFKKFLSSIAGLLYFSFYFGQGDLYRIENLKNLTLFFILLLVLSFYFLRSLFQFLNLKAREYVLYRDTITYTEGFLTKKYAFVPLENLADTEITQSLVDKLFGLYDITLSSQGSGREILFKNMANGRQFQSNLDKLIEQSSRPAVSSKHMPQRKEAAEQPGTAHSMDLGRALLPKLLLLPVFLIFFPLLIYLIPAIVYTIIRARSTTYLLKRNSVEEKYDFISSKKKEFTKEMITGAVVKRDIFDRFMGTITLEFWSIGSNDNITFKHIMNRYEIVEETLAMLDMEDQEQHRVLKPAFDLASMMKGSLYMVTAAVAVLIALLIGSALISDWLFLLMIPVLGIIFLSIIYKNYYYKTPLLALYKEHASYHQGIFYQKTYYVHYDNIMGITTRKYPFSGKGSITFNIAGEQRLSSKSRILISHRLTIDYVEEIARKHVLLELISSKNPVCQKKGVFEKALNTVESQPDPINTLVRAMLLLSFPTMIIALVFMNLEKIYLFPGALLLDMGLLILSYGHIKKESYCLDPYRVVARRGILFKEEKFILFVRIDYIRLHRGLLNKIFNNGSITIQTTGSSSPELIIHDIQDYNKVSLKLKNYYS